MGLRARWRVSAAPAVLFTVALIGAACTACGGADGAATSTMMPTCTPAPTEAVTLEGKAATFDLSGVADPIGAVTQDGYILISARATGDMTDLVTEFQTVVTAAGFDLAGSDNEGFEAEVFFARGNVAAGQVVLTQSPCPGEFDVKISVLDDPAVFSDDPSGTPPG